MDDDASIPVTFEPSGRTLYARPRENLLALAQRGGVHIDSSCGGGGSCLQCRVSIRKGDGLAADRGGPPRALDEPGTPDGEEQGRRERYLACSLVVTGPCTVRAEPRGSDGRGTRPAILGRRIVTGSWQRNSADLSVTIPCAAVGAWTPLVRVRGADGSIAHAGLVEQETVDPSVALIVNIRGKESFFTAEQSLARLPSTHRLLDRRLIEACPLPMAALGLMLAGCHFDRRAAATAVIAIGPKSFVSLRTDAAAITSEAIPTPFLAGTAGGSMPRMLCALRGAIDTVEFSPMTPRAIVTTVGNAPPIGVAGAGLVEFAGEGMRAGLIDASGRFKPSRGFRDDEAGGGRRYVLSSPGVAAMSPTGEIWNANPEVAVSEAAIAAVSDEMVALVRAAQQLGRSAGYSEPSSVVVAGGVGFHPSRRAVEALLGETGAGLSLEVVGDALSAGAAMCAAAI